MKKRGGGKHFARFGRNFKVFPELLPLRKKIHGIMKSSLEKPVIGPDFGGRSLEGKYLEAYKRYSKGSFMEGLKESGVNLKRWFQKHELFFISALYGLVNWKEPIQNYDLDLQSKEIYGEWKSNQTITSALLNYLSNIRNRIDCVIDCCGNNNYRHLIDWRKLRKFEVRYVIAKGDFTPSQIRFASGYLAGLQPEILNNMINDENQVYRNPNAVIRLARELTVICKNNEEKEYIKIPVEMIKKNKVAVACLRDEQYEAFLNYIENHGLAKLVECKKLKDLNKKILYKLDKNNYKILVVHVDAPHAVIDKHYKLLGKRIEDLPPKYWQIIKITNNSYSAIKFELNIRKMT